MEAYAGSTTRVNDEDVLSAASNKSIVKRHGGRFLTYVHLWSEKWSKTRLISITFAFLIGSIASVILSEVVQSKRSTIDRIFPDDLNPSCTDFGNSVAEHNFAIDLAYGNFTFTQAKIIDATWDTVIGQGGRLLHGWILYRCVIYPLLIVAMEISTVTYFYYTTLSFSKSSFETLLQLLRTLHLTRSYSVLLCTVLLIYTLAYTLLFPLVWGTATGYLSLSHKLYAMPGGDVVRLNSENLSLCWVLDPTRPELPMTTPHIEYGPKFSTILSTRPSSPGPKSSICINLGPYTWNSDTYDLLYDFSGWRVKSAQSTIFETVNGTSSENFLNIQRYALARQFLQIGLDARNWTHFGWETWLNQTLIKRDEPVTLDWWGKFKLSPQDQCNTISQGGLYPSLYAVTLEEPGALHSTQDGPMDSRPYNESRLGTAYWSLFNLNQSVQPGPGIVPYNSTIRLDGRTVALDAPFLDVGFNCSSSANSGTFNSLGNCVCYKGQPIPLDLLSNDRAICNTAPGYVWGFSSYLTRLGLILEAVWMASCFVAYPWLLHRSKLLHTEPVKSAKDMRLLLDCSEAVRKDLGPVAAELREAELAHKLENIEIGYRTNEAEGKLKYCIESGLTTKGFAERHMGIATWWSDNISAGKRRPTANEVYEDLNWRF